MSGRATIFAGSKIKTLKSTLNLNGGADVISSTVDPTLTATNALPGSLLLNTSNGKVYRKLDSGSTTNWEEVGAGVVADDANYISNPDAEVDTSNWTIYDETDAVTFTDTGDLVTLNNHGLQNGQMVMFRSIVSTTGITTLVKYYVISATTNTFQVSSAVGGSAIALTTNGTGVMTRDRPRLGTGGTPNFQWTRDTSGPLRGVADFKLTNNPGVGSSLGSLGQGVSTDFTIDNADLAKVLTVSFDYEWLLQNGTLGVDVTDHNYTVYLIQDPTGTPVVIQPAGFKVQVATIGTKARFSATFQTSSTVKNYRLCIHASNVNNFSSEILFDSIAVSPQQVVYGAPVTDWQSYTPTTQGFGTVTNMVASYRRVGGSVEVQFYFEAGTPTATEARFGLPTGLTITGLTSVGNSPTAVGYFNTNGPASSSGDIGAVSNNTYVVFNPLNLLRTNANGNGITVVGTGISAKFSVPILGWSSSVVVSSSTDTRVVAAKAAKTAIQSIPNNSLTKVTLSSSIFDTHSGFDFVNSRYVIQVPGIYRVSALVAWGNTPAGARSLRVYKNGSVDSELYNTIASSATGIRLNGSVTVSCVAGDYLEIYAFQDSGGALNIDGTIGSAFNYFSVERLSGPSQIAASETVAMRAYNTSGFSVPNASVTTITGWTKSFDTHGAFNATTGVYTVPVSGKYRVSGMLLFNAAAFSITNPFSLIAQQGGSASTNWVLGETWPSANGTSQMSVNGSDVIQCNAGDTISISAYQSQGGARTIGGAATENHVDIQRIGN